MTNESKCDHTIGLKDGVDESWLVFESSEDRDLSNYFDVAFKYCPDCGEKLPDLYGGEDSYDRKPMICA